MKLMWSTWNSDTSPYINPKINKYRPPRVRMLAPLRMIKMIPDLEGDVSFESMNPRLDFIVQRSIANDNRK